MRRPALNKQHRWNRATEIARNVLNQQLLGVLGLALALLLGGTLGYMVIERWTWSEAFFMTVITLSTVGYGEVQPLSETGEFFTVVLILLGVGAIAYTFSTVADYIVAGELRGILRKQRMMRAIEKMNDHYIVCGYGRVGQQVTEGLLEDDLDVLVIDSNEERSKDLEALGVNFLIGNAADDDVLEQSGIERAAGLCACLPKDATNVFVTLTARTLNPNLIIIARSNTPNTETKLRIAGANQVINPYLIAGRRMAAQLVHPSVTEFLDVVMRRGELELHIEEFLVSDRSDLAARTLADSRVRSETGVNVLAVRRPDGRLFIELGTDFVLNAGDTIIGLGTPQQLSDLAERAFAPGRLEVLRRLINQSDDR